MAAPSLTYTLTNGNTADASQVMQDLNDILNGVTDGTKDLTISALIANGAVSFKGTVGLGDATADDITVTGSLASTISIKTNNAFNIGSATLGLAGVFLGNGGAGATCKLVSASHATTRVYTVPDAGAAANVVLSEATATINGAKTFTNLAGCTATGVTLFPDGTAALPSIALTNATTTGFYKSGTNALGFATNASARGNIDANGVWTIGGASVTHKINGGGSTNCLQIAGVASGDLALHSTIIVKVDAGSATTQKLVLFQVNAGVTNQGEIQANGSTSAQFAAVSDRRIKDNITPLSPQLGNVLKLKPCTFDLNDRPKMDKPSVGFIAQEMQEVYPDFVYKNDDKPDGLLGIGGWSATDAHLVAAIQELNAKVDALAARVP